jgi:hypothetical protein
VKRKRDSHSFVSLFFIAYLWSTSNKLEMRLTVHVKDAKKATKEKRTPEGPIKIRQTFTTLSFSGVRPEDVNTILGDIKAQGLGTPTKHYLSGEKIPGHSRGKKKS